MSLLTTHILDTSRGRPAQGVAVKLEHRLQDSWTAVAHGTTDSDGRISDFGPQRLEAGHYRLCFEVADYLETNGGEAFFPRVTVEISVSSGQSHYHVPLLLSPFGYSTYRGS